MEKETLIIIDNGHGHDTKGKCSPGGQLKEWEWTRQAARMLAYRLHAEGFKTAMLVPESYDVALSERCRRANKLHADHGKKSVLISLHCNAAGNGADFKNASGFSDYVCPSASDDAKKLAVAIWDAVTKEPAFKGNRARPFAGYLQANYYILSHTSMPAVLLECLFMDNMNDLSLLMQPSWQDRMMMQVAEAVKKCCP